MELKYQNPQTTSVQLVDCFNQQSVKFFVGAQGQKQTIENIANKIGHNELKIKELCNKIYIAIDPSYIKKSGKCTPYMGSFGYGCAGAVKRGLEFLGIGVIDVDLHECMMLKAVQTTLDKDKENDDMSLYDWYAKVLLDNKQILQRITSALVADSAFSKKPFIDNMLGIGFNVLSRLRHDAALYYLQDGEPTGKPGRPRVKGEKIDFKELN